MDTVDPTGPTVIAAPEGAPVRGTPLLVFGGILALAVGASFVVARLLPAQPFVDLCAKLFAVAAALGFATAVEHGIQGPAAPRRALLAVLVIAASIVIGIGGGVGCLRLSPALGDRGTLGLICFVTGLWLGGLALGTLWFTLAGSRGGSLQSRLVRVLCACFLLAVAGSLAGAEFGAHWLEALKARQPDLFAVFSPYRERVLSTIGLPGIWTSIVALLIALPAALSASRRLVAQTFEGIALLESASETVAAGRLELRIEHSGGSREVRGLVRAYNEMLHSLGRVRALERAFAPKSAAALSRLRRHVQSPLIAPEQREATFVVAELRDLVELSEAAAPDRVLALLDRFFSTISAAVDKYEGHLERLDAGGFVAVFNLPLGQSDHMTRATRCAIECQTELVALKRGEQPALAGKLTLAIGVASGPVISGSIEGNGQPRYVALGETLELAARLATFTPAGQVWVNQRNAEALPLHIPSVMLAAISLRGRVQPVAPFRVWPPP